MLKKYESPLERALILHDHEFKSFFQALDIADRRFVREKVSHYPRPMQRIIINECREQPTLFDANTRLRTLTKKLDSIIPPILLNYFDASEADLRLLADDMATRCQDYETRERLKHSHLTVNEITNSVNASKRNDALEGVYNWCADFVNRKGLQAPKINSQQSIEGCIKRMQDKGWWLRKLLNKSRETVLIELNQVNRLKGIYCSDLTAAHRKQQKQNQLKMLETLVMTNESGEQFSLRDIYDVNVSNPTIRRNELMTRIRGFEDISKDMGHKGVFVTLTCPSKYHRAYSKSGQPNLKWAGLTPYDGQQYLCSTWARMRAAFDRQEIRVYGLRVAEPQHDGTPHWHLMLFVEQHQAEQLKSIMEHYSFEEDGDEQGAKENRVKFVDIDPKKGSATGYVAKYVCKNIDGANLDESVYGEDPILAAQRVEAWASCWGIRQF